ncbi:gliding motility lipoprotein GldB [Tenacibaculum jejuense]|uniref:Gliding motility protein n=1 Tax=Tenacibaculum jejuense TaxID=584609 RepID=A0A238UG59_9FLAO|nr:gliding motility lipoprotein GldB [Tenacibaculum jejuense]SNR17350.1 Gliding motility protein [Tenacibaculum jejuense]
MRKIICLFIVGFIILSCKKEEKFKVDVSKITVDSKLYRFDIDFYTATEKTLSKVKEKYPLLFPHNNDSVWVNKIQNKDEQELFAEVQKKYADFTSQVQRLKSLFQHVTYYNKKFVAPVVITMLTNIDYDNRVVYNGDFMLISLDCYLGASHEFYNDYPQYVKQNNTEDHIIVDAANAIVNVQLPPNTERSFINKMIYEGKKLYLLDRYLPNISDKEKIGYASEKFDWAVNSEEDIWKYFIERDLLYSTDSKLNKRFLDIAPFSKFYLGEDNLSPGRIGAWVGWQIVRSYMQNNDVSLQELLSKRGDEIFKKSKYKPKRK